MFLFWIHSAERLNDKLDVTIKKSSLPLNWFVYHAMCSCYQKLLLSAYWFHIVIWEDLFWKSLGFSLFLGMMGAWFCTDVIQRFEGAVSQIYPATWFLFTFWFINNSWEIGSHRLFWGCFPLCLVICSSCCSLVPGEKEETFIGQYN